MMSVCTSSPRTFALAGESSTARLSILSAVGQSLRSTAQKPASNRISSAAGETKTTPSRRGRGSRESRSRDGSVCSGSSNRQRHGGRGRRLAIPVGDRALDRGLEIVAGGLGRVDIGRGGKTAAGDRRRRETPHTDCDRRDSAVVLGEVAGRPGLEGGRVQSGKLVTRDRPAGMGEKGQHVLPDETGVPNLDKPIEIRIAELLFRAQLLPAIGEQRAGRHLTGVVGAADLFRPHRPARHHRPTRAR